MLAVAEARRRILAPLTPVGTEILPLAQAWRRVLAAPVLARLAQPPADVSAMDGYALRAEDALQGAALRVIGAAPAGHPFPGGIGPGEAVRIFTGSVIPPGADTVLLQEDAAPAGARVTVQAPCRPGRHIRKAAQDFAAGDRLIAAGRRLSARDIGLAAAGNHPCLTLFRRPRIAILSTGDEISLPGEPVGPGGIVNSNAPMLAAFVQGCGGEAVVLPIAADDPAAIAAAADAARGTDLLVTMGGASVGEHDLVQAGLAAKGLRLDFWKIAMRPGKPLMSGSLAGLPLLGLPGNAVAAFVCALLFLRPAIEKLGGATPGPQETETARLQTPLPANGPREDYLRARLSQDAEGWRVTPLPVQDSAMLSALAEADALILRPPFAAAAPMGAAVPILRFAPFGS